MRGLLPLAIALAGVGAMPAAARPASLAAAKAYVDMIYAGLPNGGFDTDRVRYTPALRRLLLRGQGDGGEVGALDGIPFCDCQDFAEDYRFRSSVARTPAGAAVTVDLVNGRRAERFVVDLVPGGQGWAISDVHGRDVPSLVRHLRRGGR